MAVNSSKVIDLRFHKKWAESGTLGTLFHFHDFKGPNGNACGAKKPGLGARTFDRNPERTRCPKCSRIFKDRGQSVFDKPPYPGGKSS